MCSHRRVLSLVGILATVANSQDADHDEDSGIDEDVLSGDQMRSLHKSFDANGDGKVSLLEIMEFSERMHTVVASKDAGIALAEMDSNKDGRLSWNEYDQDMKQWDEAEGTDKHVETERLKFTAADLDGDGLLDEKELPALFYPVTHPGVLEVTVEASLKERDADGDGKLSPQEFWEQYMEGEDDFAISEEDQATFSKLDTSGDGFLDAQELKAWESGEFHTERDMEQLIQLADLNGDSHITPDELDAAKEAVAGSDAQYHLMNWAEGQEL